MGIYLFLFDNLKVDRKRKQFITYDFLFVLNIQFFLKY